MAQSKTLSDLKAFAKRINSDRTDKKSVDQNLRAIQNALRNVSQASDWTFLRTRRRVVTNSQITSGAVNFTADSTLVRASSNASAVIANFIGSIDSTYTVKLAGEQIDYDISARNSSTSITLVSPYVGSSATKQSYIIFRRSYDLPANFREMIAIVDVRNPTQELERRSHKEMLELSLQRADGAEPECYSIENKTADAVRQLWLYPFPNGSTKFQYDLIYQRWPTIPTADTDVIDWPNDHIPLLEAAIAVEVALENEDRERYELFMSDYAGKLRDAVSGDVDESASFFIGGGRSSGVRRRFPLHLNVSDLSS